MKLDITKSQAKSLIEFIEIEFLNSLRNDVDIDNMQYVVNVCDVYKELKKKVGEADAEEA